MKNTQVIIIGGGLAGLTAAIHLSLKNINVILIEKEKYPHHKVCGEYLSNEVTPYLKILGLDLDSLEPAKIKRLKYSSKNGESISCDLELGGLGISRYALDNYFFRKSISPNCQIIYDTVTTVKFEKESFLVYLEGGKSLEADFVLGAYGKRSNLDKSLKRPFFDRLSGWLAIKAHYRNDNYPEDLVSLHNFNGGYCGLSKTETGAVNACYLASYKSFRRYKNIETFKEKVLLKNPELEEFFLNSEALFDKDLSIAQVSFDKKNVIEDHILMLGDAAGLIHPLCGNGMAMAIHSAKLAAEGIIEFYENKHIGRSYVEGSYQNKWNLEFKSRIRAGRILQHVLLNSPLSEITHGIIKNFPAVMPQIIKRTHGQPFYA
ncbi:NAD(P)/FAD-dependent oxidoreductase [Gramella jeungdoensis]|uniref:NAD(P)/FAD-dependent oxidoreductase n=1 Tax=Gramella jeungdoensis TaxID=708091 RepID=A0ABT0Z2Z8_9FLAO|nr:NAD(P)/FAD-dependent oxidoreductase [Gramella jeungdoensis]